MTIEPRGSYQEDIVQTIDIRGKVCIIIASAQGLTRRAFAKKLLEAEAKFCLSDLNYSLHLRHRMLLSYMYRNYGHKLQEWAVK